MLLYIAKRILWIIPVLIGVTIVVFTILYFAPGDPAILALGDGATPEAIQAYRVELGIDGSFAERLGRYLLNLCQGDLGLSYRSRTPVINELATRFLVTLDISMWSIILGVFLGIFFGIVSALKQNTFWDTLSTGAALFGVSMPMFWQGLMLILIFSVGLKWLPASGYGNTWKQVIMPVLALGVNSSATIMRTTRSCMLEVLRQDYIRTAKAKGQTYGTVIIRHALSNAMIPIITVIGLQLSALLAGSIVTEVIFSIAGVGKYLVDSISARDYAAVQGCVLLIAFVSAILNLIVDIIYTFIDPRMKTIYENKKSKRNLKKCEVTPQ